MTLLVVDDEENTRELCATVAAQAGLHAITVPSAELALQVLERDPVDIVLADLRLPGMTGLDFLQRVTATHPRIPAIVLTQFGSIESAISAMKLGARDYVTKPFRVDELRSRLTRAKENLELAQENRALRQGIGAEATFGSMIGTSPKMLKVYELIDRVGPGSYSVLILGESGTGKELVARAVHQVSPRSRGPFVPVDCSAISPTLIESELFGHVRGAFTGAVQSKRGLLEAANGGTLFLDEIGEMPLEMQAKLLRAIQEREVRPVGATERRAFDVRIVAATNRDLEFLIREGKFRQDLYFRLNVVQIKLPPLRERKNDIPALALAFIAKKKESGSRVESLTPEAMQQLLAYDWPGNVRELENCIERALAVSGLSSMIDQYALPSSLNQTEREPARPLVLEEVMPLEELERRAIIRTLRETQGDKVAAARLLGIGKTTLYRKLKEYKLPEAAPR